MKTLWKIASVLAFANLLALIGFGGWLKATDRVSMERVRDIRTVFTETVSAQLEREEAAEEARIDKVRLAELAAAEAIGGEPVPAKDRIRIQEELAAQGSQRLARMQREMAVLQKSLVEERQRLDADVAALKIERDAFNAERERIRLIEGDGQFKLAVASLNELDTAVAMSMLTQIMGGTTIDGSNGMAQAVSYLNAMEDDARTDIIEEFAKADAPLAADLLERLRTYGQIAQSPEDSGG